MQDQVSKETAIGASYVPATQGRSQNDLETQKVHGRKMNRIDGGINDMGPEDDSAMTIEKQLELESANSIKYRTCSWQKVNWVI